MIALTYMSTATAPFEPEALVALLEESRRNNHAAGLTGMLLYADGHFIQTLEGPPAAVDATYRRICGDPRHRDVIVALRDEITERVFGEWSMGFDEVEGSHLATVPGFSEFMTARTELQRTAADLGRAGIFHRIFRDRMRA